MSEQVMPRRTRVLLSFSSAYVCLAKQLAADLNRTNIDVLFDQWKGGAGLPERQSVSIRVDDVMFVLPLLTPSEVAPIWIGAEWQQKIYDQARIRNIDVLPVLGANCRPPEFLEQLSYANLSNHLYAGEFQRLVRTISHRSGDRSIRLPVIEDVPSDLPSPGALPATPILIAVAEDLALLLEDESGMARFREQLKLMHDGLFYELGVTFPAVHLQVVQGLPPFSAQLLINAVPELQVEIPLGFVMVNESAEKMLIHGYAAKPALNPVAGPCFAWIPRCEAPAAVESGLTTWDSYAVLVFWLCSVLRNKAADFIGIENVQVMLNQIEPIFPQLIAETVPKAVSLFTLTDVLRRLLVEEVSIRNLSRILASLAEWSRLESDPLFLAEYVRAALKRQITYRLARGSKQIVVFLLDPDDIELVVRQSFQSTPTGFYLDLEPGPLRKLLEVIQAAVRALPPNAQIPVLLTTMDIRAAIRRLVAHAIPDLQVISYHELTPDCHVQPIGRISVANGIHWAPGIDVDESPLAPLRKSLRTSNSVPPPI